MTTRDFTLPTCDGSAPAARSADDAPLKRCAIYTRTASTAGPEQEASVLDAQRATCLEYILRQPGWTALPTRYDDRGFPSLGTERPALQQLLADVVAGRIDVVVTYTICRLSRSPSECAELLDWLCARGIAFVSATQVTQMSMLITHADWIDFWFRFLFGSSKEGVG